MIKPALMIAAFTLAFSGAAMAHGTKDKEARHVRSDHAAMMHSDAATIDRCNDMHYGEKVACLRQSRSGYNDGRATGATSGVSGSGMTGATQGSLKTPAGANETQPGQSSRSNRSGSM